MLDQIVGEVKSVFEDNTEEIYVLGSVMRLHFSQLGYCEQPDHQPRDTGVLVKVRDISTAIQQFERWDLDPQLHLGFNNKLNVSYLKIYPEVEVSYPIFRPVVPVFHLHKRLGFFFWKGRQLWEAYVGQRRLPELPLPPLYGLLQLVQLFLSFLEFLSF